MRNQPAEQQQKMIAVAAYYRAEHRGFLEGDPVADWLEVEAEIEQMFLAEPSPGMSAKQSFQEKLETELGIPAEITAIVPIIVGVPSGKTEPTSRKEAKILAWN